MVETMMGGLLCCHAFCVVFVDWLGHNYLFDLFQCCIFDWFQDGLSKDLFEDWVSLVIQWNLLDQLVYTHHHLLPWGFGKEGWKYKSWTWKHFIIWYTSFT